MTLNCIRQSYICCHHYVGDYGAVSHHLGIGTNADDLMGVSIVPCLAGGNASAACIKMLVMRFADVQ